MCMHNENENCIGNNRLTKTKYLYPRENEFVSAFMKDKNGIFDEDDGTFC